MEWTPARMRLFRDAGLCLSQDKFAKALGFAKRTIGNAERGTHPPSLSLRRALDRALEDASDAQRARFIAAITAHHGLAPIVNGTTGTTAALGTPTFESVELLRGTTTSDLDPASLRLDSAVQAQTGRQSRHHIKLAAAQIDDLLAHLRDQWHVLVKTDNILGPQYALHGVLAQLQIIHDLLGSIRESVRLEVVKLGAQYAESAAWLYEDRGHLSTARYWNSQAMKWAHEADDHLMLSWTLFRRSQHAVRSHQAGQVIGLAQAAERERDQLPTPMPERAIRLYEATIPELPLVYRRDRGMAIGRSAAAYVDTGEPEQAARVAAEALSIAQSTGSTRTLNEVMTAGRRVMAHRNLPPVAEFLDELRISGCHDG